MAPDLFQSGRAALSKRPGTAPSPCAGRTCLIIMAVCLLFSPAGRADAEHRPLVN